MLYWRKTCGQAHNNYNDNDNNHNSINNYHHHHNHHHNDDNDNDNTINKLQVFQLIVLARCLP